MSGKVIEKPVQVSKLSALTVEDAVNALIPHLPEPIQEFLLEMEIQEGHSPVEYILGYINRHYETGELSYRPTEGAVTAMGVKLGEVARHDAGPQEKACEQCGTMFTVKALGQRFCPDPPMDSIEESCGSKWNRAERIRQAEARGDRRYTQPDPDHVRVRDAMVAQGWRR